ncbi:sulfotransferase [Plantactinospora sp. WMMC1484]|uniref:sulfotransferase n=1 Tax=Plantactinospora sp. WMMC1484 TaxID=3404122 RepID=UPI003BF6136A
MAAVVTGGEPAVFVLGTGRCGSTMVSELLGRHPAILSLSEFFVLFSDMSKNLARLFPGRVVDAGYFWSLLSEPQPFLRSTLRNGVVGSEFRYLHRPARRFDVDAEVPPILLVSLCLLSDDPEALYDEVRQFVATLPPATTPGHFQCLIRWLRHRLGRAVSVERSGGSIAFARTFAEAFPHARFVHVVRDGRSVAMSMRRQRNFRLVYVQAQLRRMLGYNPFEPGDPAERDTRDGPAALSPEFRELLPENFSAEVFERLDIPPAFFGAFWSSQLAPGCAVLRDLPAGRVHTVRYEDVLRQPAATLDELVRFVGADPMEGNWLSTAAAGVRPAEPPPWRGLPPAALEALVEATAPGFAALGDAHRS